MLDTLTDYQQGRFPLPILKLEYLVPKWISAYRYVCCCASLFHWIPSQSTTTWSSSLCSSECFKVNSSNIGDKIDVMVWKSYSSEAFSLTQPYTKCHGKGKQKLYVAVCESYVLLTLAERSELNQFSSVTLMQIKQKLRDELNFRLWYNPVSFLTNRKRDRFSCLYKKVYSKSEVWKGKLWYIEQAYYLYISETLHRMPSEKSIWVAWSNLDTIHLCAWERLWTDQTVSGY